MSQGMVHLNNDILCAIDIKFTGNIVSQHDMIQICILPVDAMLKPNIKGMLPFWCKLCPDHPDNYDQETTNCNKAQLELAMSNGLPKSIALNIFNKWFDRLDLRPNKKIAPLVHNWAVVRTFLVDWLGSKSFETYFDWRARDVISASLFCNDVADFKSESYPYPKHHIQFLCSQLKVERNKVLYDSLSDAISLTEIYRRMLCIGPPESVA